MKLLHAADLHLDAPFAGLSPEQAALRRAEQRTLVETLCERCRTEQCALLLLAGDLFDAQHVYRDTLDTLKKSLADCGAQVFIAPGNHDSLLPGSPYLTGAWPQNVHIFTSPSITGVTLEPLCCRVWGAGFPTPHTGSLLGNFHAPDEGLLEIMVLHGDAVTPDSAYNPITVGQIAQSGLSYLALGHIHKRALEQAGSTVYGWPGCPMGRGFDECGEKGVYLGTVQRHACRMEFVPMGARRYEILELAATDEPLAAVTAALRAQTADDIYRIILTGEAQTIDIPALYAALSPRFFALTLRDRTIPPVQLWAAAQEDSLKGNFLRLLKTQYDAASAEQRPMIALAARTGLDILEGREVCAL